MRRRFLGGAVVSVAVALATGSVAIACGSTEDDAPGCVGAACEAGAPDTAASDDRAEAADTDGSVADGGRDSSVLDADGSASCTGDAGTLDESFGDGGIAVLSFGNNTVDADAIAVQSDGKILVAGAWSTAKGFAVVRLNPNGTLDSTFGTGGAVEKNVGGVSAVSRAIALQPDGKILVAGFVIFPGTGYDAVVMRFLSDGSPDNGFGTAGVVLTDVDSHDDQALALSLQPDGRIVIAGQTLSNDLTVSDMLFVRYLSNGAIDGTFGTSGISTVDFRGTADIARSIAFSAGGIVAAGTSRDPATSRTDIAVVRLDSSGVLDPAFGVAGRYLSSFGGPGSQVARALAVDAVGRPLVAGTYGSAQPNDFAVLRITVGGMLDTTFGTGGLVTTDFGGRSDDGFGLGLQADGRVIVVGPSLGLTPSDSRVAIGRYLPNGGPDPLFASGGSRSTSLPTGFSGPGASAIALVPCGAIVAGGWDEDAVGLSRIGLVRYRR